MVYKELQTIDLSNVKQVVPTMYTTFALTEDGSLYGWGYNGYGLFLDGTHKNSDTPKLIMKDVASVAASKFGSNNVAVITKDGKLLTWGENQYGQIGDGTTETPREPKEIFSNVKSVAVGYNFMAAVKNDGSLWMWGDNKHGQLTSAIAEEYTATPTRILEDVDSVDVGLLHILALKDNGSVNTASNTIKLFLTIFNEFKNSLPQSNYLLIVYHKNIFRAKNLRFYLLN